MSSSADAFLRQMRESLQRQLQAETSSAAPAIRQRTRSPARFVGLTPADAAKARAERCPDCEHYDDTGNGAPACDLVTPCGRSKIPCAAKFARLTKCPIGQW